MICRVLLARLVALTLSVVMAAGAVGCGWGGGAAAGGAGTGADGMATVARVVDGDTLVVRVARRDERVRLIGIDTPESVKPNAPVQCFAKEASERTKTLLPPGTTVRLVRDVEMRDDYGRLLAYVYRQPDNLFVNLALVAEGYAMPYRHPPDLAHADELSGAARAARSARLGLWAACPANALPHHSGFP